MAIIFRFHHSTNEIITIHQILDKTLNKRSPLNGQSWKRSKEMWRYLKEVKMVYIQQIQGPSDSRGAKVVLWMT